MEDKELARRVDEVLWSLQMLEGNINSMVNALDVLKRIAEDSSHDVLRDLWAQVSISKGWVTRRYAEFWEKFDELKEYIQNLI